MADTDTSLMSSRTWPAGAEVFGEYQDSFREDGGVWRFTERVFTIYRRPQQALSLPSSPATQIAVRLPARG